LVEATAARDHFTRVAVLRLEVGALACVEPQALRFALSAMAAGTCLASAEITIAQALGTAWCAGCGSEVEIESRIEPCPLCGAYPLRVTGGNDLRVLDLMVED
jgi:hydrogenase nickel incorporation protein HypA/HybF